MSFLVTRPPRPVPDTWPTSTPCSDAIRATTGETNVFSPPPLPSAATGAGSGSGSGSGGADSRAGVSPSELDGSAASAAASCVAGSGGASSAAGAATAPSGAITASFVPTSTVSPSWTRICCTTPEPGLGTSVSTLSVEISSSDSSASIGSPSCLSHLVIVPSETETPIWGMTTSIVEVVAISTRRLP